MSKGNDPLVYRKEWLNKLLESEKSLKCDLEKAESRIALKDDNEMYNEWASYIWRKQLPQDVIFIKSELSENINKQAECRAYIKKREDEEISWVGKSDKTRQLCDYLQELKDLNPETPLKDSNFGGYGYY